MNKLIEIIKSYLDGKRIPERRWDGTVGEFDAKWPCAKSEIAKDLSEKLISSGLVFEGYLERMSESFKATQQRILDDTNRHQFSDGYHAFEELYEHRYALFVALINSNRTQAWRALANADGQKWEGWFIAGLFPEEGQQITYHLPMRFWESLDGVPWFEVNPYFDGHTSEDVIKRLISCK
jgi:hypothetical protein